MMIYEFNFSNYIYKRVALVHWYQEYNEKINIFYKFDKLLINFCPIFVSNLFFILKNFNFFLHI